MDLIVMAAGMGSRFGGLKQIEPVGLNGEFIIDYNIYDAIKCGFKNIILIIKEEHEEIFRETIGKRISKFANVKYVYQKSDIEREKPLGTAHAILCAKDAVNDNFAVINSDDYYGRDAFRILSEYLKEMDNHTFGTVSYKLENTLAKSGSVKRGVLTVFDDEVVDITESIVEKKDNVIYAKPLDGAGEKVLGDDTLVSMSAFAFSLELFNYLKDDFKTFLETKDLSKDEFLIPDVIKGRIFSKDIKMKSLKTTSKWYGMTYKEDKEDVKEAINNFIKEGIYPENLWDEDNFK